MLRFFSWVLLLAANGLQADGNAGATVVRRHTMGDHTIEFTTYTMGDRQRTESRNSVQYKNADGLLVTVDPPANVSITRCDLGQSSALNTKTMEYTSAAYPPGPLTPEKVAERELMERKAAETALPTLRIELTTVDTGERREMFGYMAR